MYPDDLNVESEHLNETVSLATRRCNRVLLRNTRIPCTLLISPVQLFPYHWPTEIAHPRQWFSRIDTRDYSHRRNERISNEKSHEHTLFYRVALTEYQRPGPVPNHEDGLTIATCYYSSSRKFEHPINRFNSIIVSIFFVFLIIF